MARVTERKRILPSILPSRTTLFFTGLAVGVLFAPRSGRVTRSLIVQKYQYWMSQVGDLFDRMARLFQDQSNRLQGVAYEMQEGFKPADDYIDDATLPQRIKSELGRFFNVSDLEINCRDGIVTLRGGIGNDQEKQNMIELAKRVKGVREVVSMLY
jgi:gas vesicle protein